MTATVKPWNQFAAAGTVVEADKLILVDVSDTTEGADGTVKIATVGTVATVFAPYIAEAETAENNATAQANAAAASAAAAAAIVNISSVQTFTNSLRRAVRAAMTAATTGSNGISVLSNPAWAFLDSPFTIFHQIKPAGFAHGSGTQHFALTNEAGLSTATPTFRFTLSGGNVTPAVAINGVIYSATQTITQAEFLAGNKWGAVFVPQTAVSAGSITYYRDGVIFGAAVAVPAGTPLTFTGSNLRIEGREPVREPGDWFETIIYNRNLSATQMLELAKNGPETADTGASQVPVYTSNFSAGLDGWAATGGVSAVNAGNIDTDADGVGVPPSNDWQRSLRSGSAGTLGFYGNDAAIKPPTTVGNRLPYAECDVFIPPGSPVTHITASWENNTNSIFAVSPGVNRITFGGAVLTNTTTRAAFIRATNSAGVTASQPDGSAIYLQNFTWKYLGITLWLNAENAQSNTGQIFDGSGNGGHGLLPAAGATIIGRPTAQPQQVRWTNTWNGTHELQYIGGVNQAILPAKAYIESIVGVVTGATPHDIIIGDGSDTDRYVTITTGLAAGTTTFTLANRTTDGTNLKLTVDPDTNATMSIAWTITYRTLE